MADSSTRIEHGSYLAEVLQGGDSSAEPFWYYLLRRNDSPEILDLVKFKTLEDAIEGAKKAVARMHRAASAG